MKISLPVATFVVRQWAGSHECGNKGGWIWRFFLQRRALIPFPLSLFNFGGKFQCVFSHPENKENGNHINKSLFNYRNVKTVKHRLLWRRFSFIININYYETIIIINYISGSFVVGNVMGKRGVPFRGSPGLFPNAPFPFCFLKPFWNLRVNWFKLIST